MSGFVGFSAQEMPEISLMLYSDMGSLFSAKEIDDIIKIFSSAGVMFDRTTIRKHLSGFKQQPPNQYDMINTYGYYDIENDIFYWHDNVREKLALVVL